MDTHLDPVPGIHTAHPDTDMKVKEDKTHHASPSDEALASIEPHKPNHEIAASVDAAAHGTFALANDLFCSLTDASEAIVQWSWTSK